MELIVFAQPKSPPGITFQANPTAVIAAERAAVIGAARAALQRRGLPTSLAGSVGMRHSVDAGNDPIEILPETRQLLCELTQS